MPLWGFLAITALLVPDVRPQLPATLLFIQIYLYSGAGMWGHLWSLAVEEHFYLLLPFVLLALRRKLNLIPTLCVALFVACAFLQMSGHIIRTSTE
jgi:peptidoglycan/LPS O-acetylase OafA/YrhL